MHSQASSSTSLSLRRFETIPIPRSAFVIEATHPDKEPHTFISRPSTSSSSSSLFSSMRRSSSSKGKSVERSPRGSFSSYTSSSSVEEEAGEENFIDWSENSVVLNRCNQVSIQSNTPQLTHFRTATSISSASSSSSLSSLQEVVMKTRCFAKRAKAHFRV